MMRLSCWVLRECSGIAEIVTAGVGRLASRAITVAGRSFQQGAHFRNLGGTTKAQKKASRKVFRAQRKQRWTTVARVVEGVRSAAAVYSVAGSVKYGVDRGYQLRGRERVS